jgi:hypothetical protein
LTSTRDAAKDPILVNDKLFNPTWDPNVKKHVAIAGVIDVHSDGRDATPEFLRALKKFGVEVDAIVDLKDGSIKRTGKGITVKTDLLIVGEGIEAVGDSRARNKDLAAKVEASIKALRKDAAYNGVTIVSFKNYLDLIGFRPVKITSDHSGGTDR